MRFVPGATSLAGACLLACCAPAVGQEGSERTDGVPLRFDPPPGAAVSWVAKGSVELSLDQSDLSVRCEHGEAVENPSGDGLAQVGDTIRFDWSSAFRDTYRSLSDDRPSSFERTWSELGLALVRRGDDLKEPREVNLESPLVGETIGFTWEPANASYRTKRMGGEGKLAVEAIDSAAPWLPFSAILADRASPQTERWSVDPAGWIRSLWPGGFGDLGYGRTDVSAEWPTVHVAIVPELAPDPEVWLHAVEGELRATLEGSRTIDGRASRVMRLELDLTSAAPIEAWLPAFLEEEGLSRESLEMLGYHGDGIEWRWLGTGELLWSEQRGLMRSLAVDGDLSVRSHLAWSYLWDAPQVEEFFGELTETWVGRMSFRMELDE